MSFLRLPLEWTNNQNQFLRSTLGDNASFESYMALALALALANQVLSRGVL